MLNPFKSSPSPVVGRLTKPKWGAFMIAAVKEFFCTNKKLSWSQFMTNLFKAMVLAALLGIPVTLFPTFMNFPVLGRPLVDYALMLIGLGLNANIDKRFNYMGIPRKLIFWKNIGVYAFVVIGALEINLDYAKIQLITLGGLIFLIIGLGACALIPDWIWRKIANLDVMAAPYDVPNKKIGNSNAILKCVPYQPHQVQAASWLKNNQIYVWIAILGFIFVFAVSPNMDRALSIFSILFSTLVSVLISAYFFEQGRMNSNQTQWINQQIQNIGPELLYPQFFKPGSKKCNVSINTYMYNLDHPFIDFARQRIEDSNIEL
jgi:hypothetical protein